MPEANVKSAPSSRSAEPPDSDARNARRVETGVVSSDKGDKTIVVDVSRLVKYPKYGKYIRRSTRYYAHDEKDEARVGDTVEIMETRPLSRLKRWRLVRIIRRADTPREVVS